MPIALAIVVLLFGRTVDAVQFQFWNDCQTIADSSLAPFFGISTKTCERYTFIRGQSFGSREHLYLVSKISTPVQINQDLLVFLDLDSTIASMHFIVTSADPSSDDLMHLTLLKKAIGDSYDFPMPFASQITTPPYIDEIDILVSSKLIEVASKFGIYFMDDNGLNMFSGLAFVSLPKLNALLISVSMTEEGRAFFKEFIVRDNSGLDAVFGWRILRKFNNKLNAAASGWFPCMKAGKRIVRENLEQIDPILVDLPINLNNMFQLVKCP